MALGCPPVPRGEFGWHRGALQFHAVISDVAMDSLPKKVLEIEVTDENTSTVESERNDKMYDSNWSYLLK